MTIIELFKSARRTSVPIIAVRSADPEETVKALAAAVAETMGGKDAPLLRWDAARGLTGYNDKGKSELQGSGIRTQDTFGFSEAMIACEKLPKSSVVFAFNAHRHIVSQEPASTATAVQALSNLRDPFKTNWRMIVMVGALFETPRELEHDVVVLDESLPDAAALEGVLRNMHIAAKMPMPKDTAPFVEALSGLSTFSAEQQTALSFKTTGLDLAELWNRKRVQIEQARGLKVWTGKERFADIVGCEAVKAKLRLRMGAQTRMGCVVWLDEIDKVFANAEADANAQRTDQMKVLLTEMDNMEWRGLIAAGASGSGKSLLAKALGNEAGVPTIAMDLADTESKWVGESEANLRHAIQVIKAIGGGNAYFVATSNLMSQMRPELQRRFTDGVWMFDLMTAAERDACWQHYMKKYALAKQQRPADEGWTGAEIRNCCRDAWDCRVSLLAAAKFILPMAKGRAEEIRRLRQFAHGRFLDASRAGHYEYDEAPQLVLERGIMVAEPEKVQ